MKIETVKIVDGNRRGFKTINKSDFKQGTHKPYSEEPKKTQKELLIEEAIGLGVIDTSEMTIALLTDAITEAKKT